MRLLVLLRDDPWLDTVLNHVVNGDSVAQMNRLLNAEHTKDLQLDAGEVVEQLVQFSVLARRLDALVDRDDQLVRLLNTEGSLRVDNRLHS